MELTKNFEPALVEEKWYQHWLSKGYFNSTPDNRPPFTVVIPPPNVTGVLHMGHTLNETVQDILVRKARMSGFNACWVPGSDHASIATEAKVVQMLDHEKGIKKADLSREEFLSYAYEWKEKYGDIIYHQIRKLGCSVDWNRVTFTMDQHYYEAVIRVFVDLYNKGKIYRGARMINWDPAAKTALSDEEVEYRETDGTLYYVKYKVVDEAGDEVFVPSNIAGLDGFLCIATQRPETIMGDTAVCVNPDDERYRGLKGKYAVIPLVNRRVPIIFDDYVDMNFGTGALKVTPAHDINDYNLGLKHNLEIIDTLTEDGRMSAAAKVFVGMDRFEARKKSIEQLKREGLLLKEESYSTRLGFSQRSNAVVEPRISTQWFVKMRELADEALEAVTSGEIKIHPEERFLATYKYWLENVKDWCISRQLWWGQRIPAWYDNEGNVFVAENEGEVRKRAGNIPLLQDEDVLDTWFSSWLWPIQVFKGITEPKNEEINYYYPTSVLVTGQDIIFFWVARMIMSGMEYKKEKPFSHVYFTGMVRDKQGRKMSKSLGNSPDLLDLIERFGADAVRFGIMISSPAGNDLLFDDSSCDQGRNFNNKIWNALKLVQSWKPRVESVNADSANEFAMEWFENKLVYARKQLNNQYETFKLSEGLKNLYSLIWDDFCSWFLEWVKPGYGEAVPELIYTKTVKFFEELLQLLHPFMPFITEEIYHHLREKEPGDDLAIKQLQAVPDADEAILLNGELLKKVITALRDARNKNNLKPKDPITLHIHTAQQQQFKQIQEILMKQLNASAITYTQDAIPKTITVVVEKDKFYLASDVAIDTNAQKQELMKDLEYLRGFLISVDKKLSNEKFVKNAKQEVVDIEKKKKADAEEKIRIIEEMLFAK